MRASPSPRHMRGPEEHTNTALTERRFHLSLYLFVFVHLYIVVFTLSPSLTGRERHEGIWLYKLTVFVEEVFRVELVRELPLALFMQR